MTALITKTLGISEADLQKARQEGKTLAQIAGDKRDELVSAMVGFTNAKIDKAVADGKLTQEQADKIKANVQKRVENRVDGKGRGGRAWVAARVDQAVKVARVRPTLVVPKVAPDRTRPTGTCCVVRHYVSDALSASTRLAVRHCPLGTAWLGMARRAACPLSRSPSGVTIACLRQTSDRRGHDRSWHLPWLA